MIKFPPGIAYMAVNVEICCTNVLGKNIGICYPNLVVTMQAILKLLP